MYENSIIYKIPVKISPMISAAVHCYPLDTIQGLWLEQVNIKMNMSDILSPAFWGMDTLLTYASGFRQ